MAIPEAVREYHSLGFETLPLLPDQKRPLPGLNWKSTSVDDLWANAPQDANIGLRCGEIAVIDCDEKKAAGTVARVQNLLEAINLLDWDFPIVQTASGIGRHIYLRIESTPGIGSVSLLAREIGSGELRYGPNCYVVAPPSRISGSEYRYLSGDIHHLPTVPWEALTPLIGSREAQDIGCISRKAWKLLRGAPTELARYATRSEAEQALISSLIRSGFTFEGIKALFDKYPCAGKYAGLKAAGPADAERYLERSYGKASTWLAENESPGKQIAKSVASWATRQPWPGRTGAVDQSVFVAHCELMERACVQPFAASSRDLALRAGVSPETASKATCRLCRLGLLAVTLQGNTSLANQYQLGPNLTLNPPLCDEVSGLDQIASHDVFRRQGFGKIGSQIFTALRLRPMTVYELSETTGRCIRTLKKYLTKMSKIVDATTGEILSLVRNQGDQWEVTDVDINHVAQIIGTAGLGRSKKQRYIEERLAHKQSLGRGKLTQTVQKENA